MQFPPFPCYLVPPRPKYSPEHPILKHPQPTFLPQCKRPSFTPTQHNRPTVYVYVCVCVCIYIYIYIYIHIAILRYVPAYCSTYCHTESTRHETCTTHFPTLMSCTVFSAVIHFRFQFISCHVTILLTVTHIPLS
jgi:hypothetical protein